MPSVRVDLSHIIIIEIFVIGCIIIAWKEYVCWIKTPTYSKISYPLNVFSVSCMFYDSNWETLGIWKFKFK